MPRLVEAMAAGDMDLFRATRIADELTECSAGICDEVLDRISPQHLAGDPVGPLGRRVRRALAAVNSDLLKQRRIRALSDTGLTRSVDADGVDTWIARMPLEQSAQLWDAIDARAQAIRAEQAEASRTDQQNSSTSGGQDSDGTTAVPKGRVPIQAARLAALTEILMGNVTGTFHLHLGVPMGLFGGNGGDPGQPADDEGPPTNPTGDGDPADTDTDAASTHPDRDDLIPVTGFGTTGTVHLRRAFLEHVLAGATRGTGPTDPARQAPAPFTPATFTVRSDVIGCHDNTGAYLTGTTDLRHWLDRIDPTAQEPTKPPRTEAYRPTAAIRRLLTARDGRCRFPRCQAAARFADVDHVQAWPAGVTELAGLALLCRRHHRIKQRPRWQVRIRADATLEWTIPTGQVRITSPIDHLEPARAPSRPGAIGEANGPRTTSSRFGDPVLPPSQPAQLLSLLSPRPRPSTGHHPDGDFGWLHALHAPTGITRGRARHPITIAYAELERCTTRRRAIQTAADTERLDAQRAAARAARSAELPPF